MSWKQKSISSPFGGATIVVEQEDESGFWRVILSPVTEVSTINEHEAKERLAAKLEALVRELKR